MIEMTHEEIERIWNSFSHYIPDRQKSDAAVDFVNTLKDIGVEHDPLSRLAGKSSKEISARSTS